MVVVWIPARADQQEEKASQLSARADRRTSAMGVRTGKTDGEPEPPDAIWAGFRGG
jgi:hypothetical protein